MLVMYQLCLLVQQRPTGAQVMKDLFNGIRKVTLTTLHDMFLFKLLSGEIQVKNVERLIEEAGA